MSDARAARVVVEGTVVHRPAQAWTPTVHAFLRHLRDAGLECVPEPLAIRDGFETVTYLPGEAGAACWPHQATDRGLRSAARLLRTVHEAARGWRPPPGARWGMTPQAGASTICHGDPGPWNMVWRHGKAVGLIDWDFAHPALALDDVAYALEYFTPFRSDEEAVRWHSFAGPPQRPRRLAAFARAYGISDTAGLVDAVLVRQASTIERVRVLAEDGVEPQRGWVADGYLSTLQARVQWSRAHRHLIDA